MEIVFDFVFVLNFEMKNLEIDLRKFTELPKYFVNLKLQVDLSRLLRFQSGLRRTSTSWISKFPVSVLRLLLCIPEACPPTNDVRGDFRDGNKGFQDQGRGGRRGLEEPCFQLEMDPWTGKI